MLKVIYILIFNMYYQYRYEQSVKSFHKTYNNVL